MGAPVWGDGNDLATIPEEAVDVLRRTGWLDVPRFLYATYPGRLAHTLIGDSVEREWGVVGPHYTPQRFAASAIEFEFTPRPMRSVAAAPRAMAR